MELNDFVHQDASRNMCAWAVTHQCALVATQAANSRLFEIRNVGPQRLVIVSLSIQWLQTSAHTAAIEDSLDVFKVTGFTAVDNANQVALTPSVKKLRMNTPVSVIQGVTVAGAAAGMTGGTLVKDSRPWAELPQWLLAAQPTGSTVLPMVLPNAVGEDVSKRHPWVFDANEGLIIENRVLLGAAAGSSVYIACEGVEIGGN